MMASVVQRIGTCLLFLVVAVSPWAAVIAYNPQSASASGSASGATEPECKPPPYSDPGRIRVNPTDDELQELLLEGRCYLACATEKYQVE